MESMTSHNCKKKIGFPIQRTLNLRSKACKALTMLHHTICPREKWQASTGG